jgi:hypothetical protein
MNSMSSIKMTYADIPKLIHNPQETTTKTAFFKFPFLNRGRYTP